MRPVEDAAGRAAPELAADLEAPDFAAWRADDLAPPDLPSFPTWDADPPAESPFPVEEPLSLPAVLWDGAVEEPPAVSVIEDDLAPAAELLEEIEPPPTLGPSAPPPAPEEFRTDFAPPESSSQEVDWEGEAPADPVSPACPAEPLDSGRGFHDLPVFDGPDEGRRARLMEWAARLWTDAPRERADAAGEPHLICTLGDQEFALPLDGVREVLRLPHVTPAPHTPDWLLGVTNRRGEILSVLDLSAFLGRPTAAAPNPRLVVVRDRRDGLTTGLVVDRVCGLRGLPPGEIAAADSPCVRGVCGAAVVLDLDGLLRSPRLRRLESD